MVEIPANHECTEWCFEEHASPPPTLVERMTDAFVAAEIGEVMAAVLAVVRAAVEGHTDWPDRWAGVSSIEREAYRDGRADAIRVVLALLGGNDE